MKTIFLTLTILVPQWSFAQAINYPPPVHENGFIVLDVLERTQFNKDKKNPKFVDPVMYPQDIARARELGLAPYSPLFSFVPKEKKKDRVEPWLEGSPDITQPDQAERVAQQLQRYIYEGWFAKNKNPNQDYDSQFRENDERTWCHTPWLNISEKGREAIHGLTKEFPIRSTSVYTVPKEIEDRELAVTWGLSFFNRKVCGQYQEFFPKEKNMIRQIQQRKPLFESPDGSVSFKLLFNAMKDWNKEMPEWEGAYNWTAHVSHARQNDKKSDGDESIRQLMNIPLVQIDISLRDSRLKGTRSDLKNWVMVSYYYDKNYKAPHLADMDIPEALKHMRPIGVQYGLDTGESIIFAGAHNNHRPGYTAGDRTELPYSATRLNGPVDNTVSSCLGCHAQSGINFGLPPGERVPGAGLGFLKNEDYLRQIAKSKNGSFDFNMQVDKAMRNFALSKKQKVEGPAPQK